MEGGKQAGRDGGRDRATMINLCGVNHDIMQRKG